MAYWKCKGEFKGFIDVYGEANANLTATTTGKSYTALADSSGYARIKVKKKGDYIISSDRTIRSAYATIVNKTPVTAQYRWNKYTSPLVYAQANNFYTYSASQYDAYQTIYNGNYINQYVYSYATGYTFNTSNGQYTLSNGRGLTLGDYINSLCQDGSQGSYPYASFPGQGQTCTTMFETRLGTSVGGGCDVCWRYGVPGIAIRVNPPVYTRVTNNTWVWYSTSSYQRGDYIGVSNGANLTTYPTDARASDGYWYVAI